MIDLDQGKNVAQGMKIVYHRLCDMGLTRNEKIQQSEYTIFRYDMDQISL